MEQELELRPQTDQAAKSGAGKNPHIKHPKTDLKVRVTAKPDGAGSILYSHELNGRKNGKIDLPRNSGPYRIAFDLDDKTQLGLRFDGAGPFFCDTTVDNICPGTIDRQQVMVDSCAGDKLVVVDWNYGGEIELHYQLNFTDGEGEPQTAYDPVILNGGGIKPS